MRDARVELSADALQHNLRQVRHYAANSRVLCMVKADAYGHGLDFAVNALQQADAFGVAFLQEALAVRARTDRPIVIMEGAFSLHEWQQAAQINAQCVIHQREQVAYGLAHVVHGATVWLKLNAGMNRLGLAADELLTAAQQLRAAGYQLILTLHFANADTPDHPLNQQQIDLFQHVRAQLAPIACSLCNSAALIQWPALHDDWVRPGIMLYGSSPFTTHSAAQLGLRPVMRFSSVLMALHDLPTGAAVGYGSRWTAQRPTRLGVVAIGYGDGYPRVVEQAQVAIDGQLLPVVGRVSMDMLMIDCTDFNGEIRLGQRVTLWGDAPHVDEVATCANTIGYELLCRLSTRPVRHVDSNDTTR